jgi:hypothetical protein
MKSLIRCPALKGITVMSTIENPQAPPRQPQQEKSSAPGALKFSAKFRTITLGVKEGELTRYVQLLDPLNPHTREMDHAPKAYIDVTYDPFCYPSDSLPAGSLPSTFLTTVTARELGFQGDENDLDGQRAFLHKLSPDDAINGSGRLEKAVVKQVPVSPMMLQQCPSLRQTENGGPEWNFVMDTISLHRSPS